jgi:hypothetical protein
MAPHPLISFTVPFVYFLIFFVRTILLYPYDSFSGPSEVLYHFHIDSFHKFPYFSHFNTFLFTLYIVCLWPVGPLTHIAASSVVALFRFLHKKALHS